MRSEQLRRAAARLGLPGWGALFAVLGGSVLYHVVLGALTIGYLQTLATWVSNKYKRMNAERKP